MMRFGLNVEDKKTLVKRIGELTGLQPRYTFMPRCAYEIGVYTVERRGDLVVVEEADLDETIIQTLLSEGLILEGIREEDRMETVIEAATAEAAVEEQEAEATEPVPAEENTEADTLTVSLPMARHTADSLRRLVNLIYSRGPLLSKSTGGQFSVDKDLITALDDAGVITSATDFISMVKEQGGLTGLSFEGDKVSFTGFPLTEDADRNKAFQQIACLMNKHALDGDEFKTSRKILMENLSGHTAFRTKEEEARWKVRQKEKREELRAEKAASQAVEPTVETQPDAV